MRIAILSDIHSNWPALRAADKDIKTMGVDAIYCLGDVTGYGPNPVESIDWARKRCNLVLMGNHDWGVSHGGKIQNHNFPAIFAMMKNIELLGSDELKYLRELEMSMIIPNLGITLAHANFTDPAGWEYVLDQKFAETQMRAMPTSALFVGHSHKPSFFSNARGSVSYSMFYSPLEVRFPEKFVINVGSVGQPRDYDPRACYTVVDFFKHKILIQYRRVSYPFAETVASMKKLGLEGVLSERLLKGR